MSVRVAEVVRKSLDLDENFKPSYAILSRYYYLSRFTHFLEDFGQKSALLGQKKCFLGKECTITWYILHIILNQICKFVITRKIDAFVAKLANKHLTKTFVAIFALAERLPTFATLYL